MFKTKINIRYIIGLLLLGSLWMFSGCSDKDDPNKEEEETISIALDATTVSASTRSQFLEVNAPGVWELSINFPPGTGQWCWIEDAQTTGTGHTWVVLKSHANPSDEERTATISLEANGERIYIDVVQRAKGATDPEPTPEPMGKWLELPELVEKENCQAVTHYTYLTVDNKKKTVRNYSMLYDTKEKLAYWVAYPLHSSYIGSYGRTDEWAADPLFSTTEQGNFIKGFPSLGYSGFDRGHQLPSGDRTVHREMNVQTFYYTNLTPQDSKLNQGIWANLEAQCRSWMAKYDTLYVVTGAILQTVDKKEKIDYMRDHNQAQVAKPNYYYKVLLGRKGETYKSVGFWFENKTYQTGKDFKPFAKTVRQIEELTGFNFFNHLPQDVQDKVEVDYSSQDWNL